MARALVRLEGLAALEKKLDGDSLFREPWRALVEHVGTVGAQRLAAASPSTTGAFPGSIKHKLQNKPLPLWTKVVGNFSFKQRWPFMLNAGAARRKSGTRYTYHYSRSGAETRGWIKNAVVQTYDVVNSELSKLISKIEAAWEQDNPA